MPSALKFILGADATPFVTAMKVLEASATKSGSVTVAQMKRAVVELEKAAVAAKAAGQSTVFYSFAVEGLNQKIATETARSEALIRATNRLAEARTKAAMAGGGAAGDLGIPGSLSDRTGTAARTARRLARPTGVEPAEDAAHQAVALPDQLHRARRSRLVVDDGGCVRHHGTGTDPAPHVTGRDPDRRVGPQPTDLAGVGIGQDPQHIAVAHHPDGRLDRTSVGPEGRERDVLRGPERV